MILLTSNAVHHHFIHKLLSLSGELGRGAVTVFSTNIEQGWQGVLNTAPSPPPDPSPPEGMGPQTTYRTRICARKIMFYVCFCTKSEP